MTTVLLADDHPLLRAGVEAVLRATPFEVVASVANGDDALTAIAQHDPAICVMDMVMPRLGGLEVLQALRGGGDQRAVVLLASDLTDEELLDAMRAKVSAIVFKEEAENTLLECLEALAERRPAMSPALLERALGLSLRTQSPSPWEKLTPREHRIAELVGLGMRNSEIAAEIVTTEGTVKVHLFAIYRKIGVENRTQLAVLVREREAERQFAH